MKDQNVSHTSEVQEAIDTIRIYFLAESPTPAQYREARAAQKVINQHIRNQQSRNQMMLSAMRIARAAGRLRKGNAAPK